MGSQDYANVRAHFAGVRVAQHTENVRKAAGPAICNVCLRYIDHLALHRRNDCQNAHPRHLDGRCRNCLGRFLLVLGLFLIRLSCGTIFFLCITEIAAGRRTILSRPLVSIRRVHGAVPLAVHIAASLSIDGDRIEILLSIHTTFTAPIDYDSIFTCIFKVFYAKKSN